MVDVYSIVLSLKSVIPMAITLARSSLPLTTQDLSGTCDNSIRMLEVLEVQNLALRERVADLALAAALLRDQLNGSRKRPFGD